MVTLKLTPVISIISLEVVFTNIEKPYGGCFSVSYQGRERQRQKGQASEHRQLSLCERGTQAAAPASRVPKAQSASTAITVCNAGHKGPPGNLKLICFQLTRTADFELAAFFF